MKNTIPFILALICFLIPCLSFADSFEDISMRFEKEFDKEQGSQNFKIYFDEFMREAKNGDARAQSQIGDMYYTGTGVEKDVVKSVTWQRMAAKQGFARAQNELATCYQQGWGVKKDLNKSVEWNEKSAKQGYLPALISLGNLYKNEDSIRDYSKSEKYLLDAAEKGAETAPLWLGDLYSKQQDYVSAKKWYIIFGDEFYIKGMAKLSKAALSDLELFGVKLATATRIEMRAALKEKGVPPIRVKDGYWADIYDSSSILSGTTKLNIVYTIDGNFAYAVYDYPVDMNKQTVVDIMTMVSNKYGQPSGSNGLPDVGKINAFWRVQHGHISLKRDWPTPAITLRFSVPSNEERFKKEYKAQEQRIKNKKAQSQTDAF